MGNGIHDDRQTIETKGQAFLTVVCMCEYNELAAASLSPGADLQPAPERAPDAPRRYCTSAASSGVCARIDSAWMSLAIISSSAA